MIRKLRIEKFKKVFPLLMALLFIISIGCTRTLLDKAFKGKFSSYKNNRVINEYCQSCHVHRDFLPDEHVDKVTGLYSNELFSQTIECKTCHYIKKNFWGDIMQKTIKP